MTPQARQPAQLRRRAAGGAALHLRRASDDAMTTVHAAFSTAPRGARRRRLPVQRVGDRAAYGIPAGDDRSWGEVAARGRAAARRLRGGRLRPRPPRRPAAREPAGVPRSTGSRSTRSASASCRSTPTCARPSWSYLIGHSEIVPGRRRCPSARRDLRAAAARGRRAAADDPAAEAATQIPPPRTPAPPRRASRSAARRECALLYTSGTTGRPEGLHAAQRLLPARRRVVRRPAASSAAVRPDAERIITPLPLNHMNAMAFSTMVAMLCRRLPGAARPLPSADAGGRACARAARPSSTTSA